MSKILVTAALAAFAVPAIADTGDAGISSQRPVENATAPSEADRTQARLRDIETLVITAPKAQPADHEIEASIEAGEKNYIR